MHVFCCGLPAAMGLFGVVLGAVAWAGPLTLLHHWLHGYEPEILMLSFVLVAIGGTLEWRRRSLRRGIPTMFALSLVCFVVNTSLITAHWLTPVAAQAIALGPSAQR
jgi:hypothetical protein